MTDTPQPQGGESASAAPENTKFNPLPMLAAPGAAPESLLGRRIATARSHYKLSAEALSRLSKLVDVPDGRGVSPPSISRYESGEALPGARELRLLCESLEVSPHWLIYGEVGQAGISVPEQALLDALRLFVASTKDDANVGGLPLSETIAFHARQAREQRLKEARRPT